MGILAAIAPREARILTDTEWLLRALGGPSTYTGRQVGVSDAMKLSAVYACVEVIADTAATLPCRIYKKLPDGGKEVAPYHRLYPILHDAPNPEMTAAEYWQCAFGHRETWGNHYSEIQFDNAGRVVGLWPLRPDRMHVERDEKDRSVTYTYSIGGEQIVLPPYRVFHLRGLSNDGLIGYSRIALAREAIALGLALEEYSARFFGNDATPGGVLTVTGKLSESGQKRLTESWEHAHRGLTKSHRVAVLEEGVSWQQIGIPARDAQFIEQRKYQVEDIARIFRVQAAKVGLMERQTHSNIEHQGIEFVTDTMRPRLVNTEQRINLSLLSDDHRGTYYAEFLVDALLRGDALSRAQALAVQRQWGALTGNEWRAIENRNPLPGGDHLWQPVNMQDPDMAAAQLAVKQNEALQTGDDPQTGGTDEGDPES